MPARRNPPVTADGLLHNLLAQMERFLEFLEVDLTPVIVGNRDWKNSRTNTSHLTLY